MDSIKEITTTVDVYFKEMYITVEGNRKFNMLPFEEDQFKYKVQEHTGNGYEEIKGTGKNFIVSEFKKSLLFKEVVNYFNPKQDEKS